MHYIIIGSDSENSVMWVMPGIWTDKVAAFSERDRKIRNETRRDIYMYVVVEIAYEELANAKRFVEANEAVVYVDTDSTHTPRTEDFTVEELFADDSGIYGVNCKECGAMVCHFNRVLHVAWHNKLLP